MPRKKKKNGKKTAEKMANGVDRQSLIFFFGRRVRVCRQQLLVTAYI